LSKELPFLLRYGDLLKPINKVDCSESETEEPEQRLSTAFTSPEQANVTQREPKDISIEHNSDSLIQLSVAGVENSRKQPISPEVGPSKFQPNQSSSPSRPPHYRPICAFSRVEDSDDTDDEGEELKTPKKTHVGGRIPVINSPSELVKLVSRKRFSGELESHVSDSETAASEEAYSSKTSEDNPAEHSQEENDAELSMASDKVPDLQARAIQRMCEQLKDAVTISEPTLVKPVMFHGYEKENVDRWLQRFTLYLANRRIQEESRQAAIQLALYLSGPEESFYYNLLSVVQASYTDLREHIKERFAPAHRSLRLRQALSIRRQGASETIEKFLADLNGKFSCLDLRNEDKLSYLVQRLRPDIQAEVLKKEPKTYAEAEDAARLIYSIQQALSQRREEDITRIV